VGLSLQRQTNGHKHAGVSTSLYVHIHSLCGSVFLQDLIVYMNRTSLVGYCNNRFIVNPALKLHVLSFSLSHFAR
jgi:hypothetical protein